MNAQKDQSKHPAKRDQVVSVGRYLAGLLTGREGNFKSPPAAEWGWTFVGFIAGIGIVTFLAFHIGNPILAAPLSISACFIYADPASVFAQPRNAFLGNLISASAGLGTYHFLGNVWYAESISFGLAVAIMLATNSMHPPAATTVFLPFVTRQDLLFPLLISLGTVILIVVAIIVNRFGRRWHYPQYWW